MSRSHQDKVAVVTGAARGIGQAICHGLAEHGAYVAGIDLEDLSETGALVGSAGGRWLGLRADVASQEDVARIAAEVAAYFGACDVLVNNAGIYPRVAWDDLDYDTWKGFFRVNLDSQFLMCKAFVPGMKAKAWGRIVNITSDSVQLATAATTPYKASKMGVIGFTRGLAGDLAPYGITVNAASPSLTRTPGAVQNTGEARLNEIAGRQLIKKVAVPDDVVGTILFLTSEDSYFVTGQTIFANGGLVFV